MPSLPIPIGDDTATVQLTPFKGEEDMYQILIDGYYHGYLKKREGVWVGLLGPTSWLQGIDVELMGEVVDGADIA